MVTPILAIDHAQFQFCRALAIPGNVVSDAPLMAGFVIIRLPEIFAVYSLVELSSIQEQLEPTIIAQAGESHWHVANTSGQGAGGLPLTIGFDLERKRAFDFPGVRLYSQQIAGGFVLHQVPGVRALPEDCPKRRVRS